MSSWHAPQKIFTCGHKAVRDIFEYPCQVQEKVDGSYFAFGLVEASDVDVHYISDHVGKEYALKIRSKGAVMHIDAPEKMFNLGAETVKRLGPHLHMGWTYRSEFLGRPKHNSLAYDRVPNHNIILFDICREEEDYLSYEELKVEADRLGLEVVPQLYSGMISSAEELRKYFDTISILGGQKIEGVVVKPLTTRFGIGGRALFAKLVSEDFKEVHRKSWGADNPTSKDVITRLTDMYRTPARWAKSVQHLREEGKLLEDVKDIGPIIKLVPEDVLAECQDEMKEELFKFAWPHIRRGLTSGLPIWYKEILLKLSFESGGADGGTNVSGSNNSCDRDRTGGKEVESVVQE